MPCENWKDALIGHLYGELSAADDERLVAHLSVCSECREQKASLAAARSMLRDAAGAVPAPSRITVLAPRGFRRRWVAFAAGFACAALPLAAGLWAGASLGRTPFSPPATSRMALGGEAPVSRQEMEARFRQYEASVASLISRQASPAVSPPEGDPDSRPLTRKDLDAALRRLESSVNSKRASDLGYVFQEMAASEIRTGTRIGQTRDALRYVALAADSRITAQ